MSAYLRHATAWRVCVAHDLVGAVEVLMMKTKIEVVANIIVILLAIAIGSVYLKDPFSTPGPQENEVDLAMG